MQIRSFFGSGWVVAPVIWWLFFSGCGGPVPHTPARPVPATRISARELFQPSKQRNCRATITRDNAFVGGGGGMDVFVDGKKVARLATRESITIFVAPGQHFVSVGVNEHNVRGEAEFEFQPNRPRYIRVGYGLNSNDVVSESGFF
jgi:hypothetical protein